MTDETSESSEVSKLKEEVEFLATLLESAYVDYLFLRPIMADANLKARMQHDGKLEGFNQIGEALYWWFIQQLVKIWDDRDAQGKNVSIRKLLNGIADFRVVRDLEERHARWTTPHGELPDPATLKSIQEREERQQREEFRDRLDKVIDQGTKLLESPLLRSYRKIRNKLIAHTEVHKSTQGLERFPIEKLRLKFGHERKLLRSTIEVIHELQSLICGVDVSWNLIRKLYEKDVAAFWGVTELDELCP
jgi:AbiU2